MDEVGQDPGELADSLRDLQVVNRWLGGSRTALRRLGPLIRRLAPGLDRPIRLLDVATGSADLPLQLLEWSRREGLNLQVVAVDFHPTTAAFARAATAGEPAIQIVRADALDLPFASGAFDLALCSTALHHFDEPDADRLLREMDRVARSGLLVSDLRRSRAALFGAHVLAATLWRQRRITRHDGPRSVAAAFTVQELRSLARRAGIDAAAVRAEPLFRLSLLVDRTGQNTT
jgi:SAM-dependent methyltransferase